MPKITKSLSIAFVDNKVSKKINSSINIYDIMGCLYIICIVYTNYIGSCINLIIDPINNLDLVENNCYSQKSELELSYSSGN